MNDAQDLEIIVNIGQFILAKKPNVLVSIGLGSCVAVIIYQDADNYAGMMHVMLPIIQETEIEKDSTYYKYANIGIPLMIEELIRKGCTKEKLKAKIAGGAHMFKNTINQENMDIGKRNIEAVKIVLHQNNIPIIAEETGGTMGRTMRFYIDTLKTTIKTKDNMQEI